MRNNPEKLQQSFHKNEETIIHNLNQQKFKKFNYVSKSLYQPVNKKSLPPFQQGYSKISYANAWKPNINQKAPTSNTIG